MEKVCPVCNKLKRVNIKCKSCGADMIELGRAQEVYQDDYTANMAINDAFSYCIHVFQCTACENLEKTVIDKISI